MMGIPGIDELDGLVFRADELRLRRQRIENPAPLSSGIPALDNILDGGWPRGALHEISGFHGRFSILLAALRARLADGGHAALIDRGTHLDAENAQELGLDLRGLLWVRPSGDRDALSAAEIILESGFQLVVIDLGMSFSAGRISRGAWIRLARSSSRHQAVSLLGSAFRRSGHAARIALKITRGHGRWAGRSGPLPLLDGAHTHIELVKNPDGHVRETGIFLGLSESPDMPTTHPIMEVREHA